MKIEVYYLGHAQTQRTHTDRHSKEEEHAGELGIVSTKCCFAEVLMKPLGHDLFNVLEHHFDDTAMQRRKVLNEGKRAN